MFDSRHPDLNHRENVQGILVEFARAHESADDRIEQLIRTHSAPRQLVVVSSDQRLQKAARRRGAAFAKSEDWLDQICSREQDNRPGEQPAEKPEGLSGKVDLEYWINELNIQPADLESIAEPPESDPKRQFPKRKKRTQRSDSPKTTDEWGDIFPPDYTDDLFSDDKNEGDSP